MGKRDKKEIKQTRVQFKEINAMKTRLHEMLRFFGQEQVGKATIKLDQFQKLRIEFVKNAEIYEESNNHIKFQSNPVQRAKILFVLTDSKKIMEGNLRQMTSLIMKLSEKVKRQKGNRGNNDSPKTKKKGKYYEVGDEIDQIQIQRTPLEQQLEYKSLIVYTLDKNYFKLIKKEDKQVKNIRKDLNNKNYASLQDFKKQNLPLDRLLEPQHEETLEQKQVLQALKRIDDMIEQRMDKVLQGIKLMNYNAINISKSLDDVHKQILINLDKVQHNEQNLKKNQKRMDEAAKHVTKPNCICNVIIAVLLGLIGFLIVKLVWFPPTS